MKNLILYQKPLDSMTKHILHAIKKFLRVGVAIVTVTSGTINASAEVIISDPCQESCNRQFKMSLDGSGYVLIDPVAIWEKRYDEMCFQEVEKVSVEIVGGRPVYLEVNQNESIVATTSSLLDSSFIGQNVKYTVRQYYSNGTVNTCWGNVLIEDEIKPNVSCTELILNCTEPISPDQLANIYHNSLASTTDNYGTPTLTFQDSEEDYNCLHADYLKKINRIWTATDGSGNQQTCVQNIFIEKAKGTTIQFPTDLNNINLSDSNFSNEGLQPSETGYPTLYGIDLTDQGLHNFSSSYQDQIIKTSDGGWSIIRKWTVVDWCSNDIFNHPQSIKINNEYPNKELNNLVEQLQH